MCTVLICSAVHAQDGAMVWADEFEKEGLPDTALWNYEAGFIRNEEQQYYTKKRLENARIENGFLIIEAVKEKFRNPDFDPSAEGRGSWKKTREYAEYTSASLVTLGKASWLYGRMEVKARLPGGKGVWPAIWTLGTNIETAGWPACGELDIMEFVGFDPQTIHANVHTRQYNHMLKNNKGARLKVDDPSGAFHVYAMEWYEDHIDFFVDDTKYLTYQNEGKGNDVWPFDKSQYLILNLAVGGSWGGQKGIDESIFPQKFIIDYVRVYRLRK